MKKSTPGPGPKFRDSNLDLCKKDQQRNLEKRFGKIFIDIKASKCHITFFRLLFVVIIIDVQTRVWRTELSKSTREDMYTAAVIDLSQIG